MQLLPCILHDFTQEKTNAKCKNRRGKQVKSITTQFLNVLNACNYIGEDFFVLYLKNNNL